MMSLYTPAKAILRNANIEDSDDFHVLADFKDCLLHKFRNNKKAAADLREALKDVLMEGISSRYVNELQLSKVDRKSSLLIYDVCGYMMKTRSFLYDDREDCKRSVITTEDELPEEFTADEFTRSRTRGGLLFVTPRVYQTISEVEAVVSEHFKSPTHV